jgi:hypothetical protein
MREEPGSDPIGALDPAARGATRTRGSCPRSISAATRKPGRSRPADDDPYLEGIDDTGTFALGQSDGDRLVFDVRSGKLVHRRSLGGDLGGSRIAPTGAMIAIAPADKPTILIDTTTFAHREVAGRVASCRIRRTSPGLRTASASSFTRTARRSRSIPSRAA